MEMDMGTLLVGAISVALFALPFILTIRGRKRKQKSLLQALAILADRYNTKVDRKEFCGNYAIGMDRDRRFVFFHKVTKEGSQQQIVALTVTEQCKAINIGRKVGEDRIIESLGLQFIPKDRSQPEPFLEFYNHQQRYQLSGELQSMEGWARTINGSIGALKGEH